MRKRKLMLIYGMIACMTTQSAVPAFAAEPTEAVADNAENLGGGEFRI